MGHSSFDLVVDRYDPDIDEDVVSDYHDVIIKEQTSESVKAVQDNNSLYVDMDSKLVVDKGVIDVGLVRVDRGAVLYVGGNVRCRKVEVDRDGEIRVAGDVDCAVVNCDRNGIVRVSGELNASKIEKSRGGMIESGIEVRRPS